MRIAHEKLILILVSKTNFPTRKILAEGWLQVVACPLEIDIRCSLSEFRLLYASQFINFMMSGSAESQVRSW